MARRYPRHPAFVLQQSVLSYRDVRKLAERMAGALASIGVQPGDTVLFLLPNLPHFPIVYYATVRLGARIAAVSPASVEREVEFFIRDSGAKTIVTVDLLYEKVARIWSGCGVKTVVAGEAADFLPWWMRAVGRMTGRIPQPKEPVPFGGNVLRMRELLSGHGQPPEYNVRPSDVAVLQYTGGTTGSPKAAMLTHANLLANARQMRAWFPHLKEGEETLLAALPFFHVYGVTLVMNAGLLLAARTILVPNPRAMGDIFEAIRRFRPSVFPGVPTLFVALIADKRSRQYDLSSIDVCVSGGAPLPAEVKRDFEALTGGHLYEGYGLSEASPVTHAQPYDESGKPGSIGLPLPDTEARVVDELARPVPGGAEGELLIRGPQVMAGYWDKPEETAQVLRGGWLHTGDIARMSEDGAFYIVDRQKDVIITGGENVYPREIEEVLFEHPKVKEAAVVGVPHAYGGEIAKAFIVPRPGETLTKAEIVRFAAQRLSKHKVPRAVEFRTELPKSSSLKVLRRVLAEEERERLARRASRPTTPDLDSPEGSS